LFKLAILILANSVHQLFYILKEKLSKKTSEREITTFLRESGLMMKNSRFDLKLTAGNNDLSFSFPLRLFFFIFVSFRHCIYIRWYIWKCWQLMHFFLHPHISGKKVFKAEFLLRKIGEKLVTRESKSSFRFSWNIMVRLDLALTKKLSWFSDLLPSNQ
jgi:hypothetical protein